MLVSVNMSQIVIIIRKNLFLKHRCCPVKAFLSTQGQTFMFRLIPSGSAHGIITIQGK